MDWPCRNNFKSIVARAIELIHAFEESIAIIKDYQRELSHSRVPYKPGPGTGCHATEAPRGLLYHRYRIGDDGLIAEARIVPPTSQNLRRIEEDLRAYVPKVVGHDDAEATRRCEHLIRNYDPVHQLRNPFPEAEDRPVRRWKMSACRFSNGVWLRKVDCSRLVLETHAVLIR